MPFEKESVRRVPPDIIDDARESYRINRNPKHKHTITVEERSVASDRATCGSCERVFKKGDKALYIEHHVDKEKNPYHINRKHVCFDKCEHKDGPAKKEKTKSKSKSTKKSPSKKDEESSSSSGTVNTQSRGDKRSHPCPYVIHGCGFSGNMEQIKKHLNPQYQNQRTNEGDPEEIAECYYNRFRNSHIKSAHCGHCGETLDFDAEEAADHIEEDGKSFTELQKRIKELEDDDDRAIKQLRSGDMSGAELHEHIQNDEEEFDELIEKIQDMKEEDRGFASELGDNRTYAESTDTYHSTDDLAQFGFNLEELNFIKFVDKHFEDIDDTKYDDSDDNIKTSSHELVVRKDFKTQQEGFHTTDKIKGISRQDKDFIGFVNDWMQQTNVVTQHDEHPDPSIGSACAHCGKDISEKYQTQRDRLWENNPNGHAIVQALEVIHHKKSTHEERHAALSALKSQHMIIPAYISHEKLCKGCNQSQQGNPGTSAAAANSNRANLSEEQRKNVEGHDEHLVHAIRPPSLHEFYSDVTEEAPRGRRSLIKEFANQANRFKSRGKMVDPMNKEPSKFGFSRKLNKWFQQSARVIGSNQMASSLSDSEIPVISRKGMREYASNSQINFEREVASPISRAISRLTREHGHISGVQDTKRIVDSSEIHYLKPEEDVEAQAQTEKLKNNPRFDEPPSSHLITTSSFNSVTIPKFGSFREVSHIDDRLQLLSEEQLEAVSRKVNGGQNVPVEEWGSSTHVHVPTEDGEEVVNTPSLTDALNSIGVWDSGDVPSFKLGPSTASFREIKIAHGDPETHIHSPFEDDEIIPAIEYPKDDVTAEEAKNHLQSCDDDKYDAIGPTIGTCKWCGSGMVNTWTRCKHVLHSQWACSNPQCEHPDIDEGGGINSGGAGSSLSYPNLQTYNRALRDHMLNVLKMVRPETGKFGSFKSVKIAQDGGGGDGGSGGDGGGAASGDGGGDSGFSGGGEGSPDSDPGYQGGGHQEVTIGAESCPRCREYSLYPIDGGPSFGCYNCGLSIPLFNAPQKRRRRSSWIDHTEPPKAQEPTEEVYDVDTSPVLPQMFVQDESMRPAPGTLDNVIFNQKPRIAPLFNAPMMSVNASVHEAAPNIVRHEKVWKRIHKIHTPRDGICPRCHKHIDYLGLCNTCRLEVGMQWHHWNSEALYEGSNDF